MQNIDVTSEKSSLITTPNGDVATWKTEKATTVPVAILNLVKCLLGAAMLSLPWAFSQSTFIPGVVALGFSVIYSFITSMFVIHACDIKGVFEYSALLKFVHPYWETVASITVIYVAFSSCLSYVILIGDFFADGIHGLDARLAFDHDITIYKAIICCCVLLPLSLLKEFKSLRASSIIGNCSNLYCVLLAIGFTISVHQSRKTQIETVSQESEGFIWNEWNVNLLIVTNVCAKAYASQYPLPPMYEQLKHRSVPRMRLVIICAFSIVTTLYFAFSFCGYYLYGGSTQGDVLLSYPPDSIWFIIARFAMGFSIIGTYPLIFKSLLQCIEDKFFNYRKGAKYNFVETPRVRTVVVCGVSFCLMIIGILVNDVGPVSSIEGAVTILGLMSLFPVLVAWKIGSNRDTDKKSVKYMAVNESDCSGLNVNDTTAKIHGEKKQVAKRKRMAYVVYLGVVMFIGFSVGLAGIIIQITSCAAGNSAGC